MNEYLVIGRSQQKQRRALIQRLLFKPNTGTMKTSATLLGLLWTIGCLGQSYRPFPEGDVQWSEYSTALNCCGPGSNTVECQRVYYFAADTTIDGLSYHKVLFDETCVTNYMWEPWPPWTTGQSGALGAFLRQDTTERKVYQWTASLGDTLLYDFNMGLGPYPTTSVEAVPMEVIAIDSVLLGDGWHKRWVLDATDFFMTPYAVIEGIGSTFGLLGPMYPPFELSQDLVCFETDSTPIYAWSQMIPGIGCDLSLGNLTEVTSFIGIPFHPNPFDQFIAIELPGPTPVRYKILHASGQVVLSGAANGKIDTHALVSGHYVLQLIDLNERVLHSSSMIKL